MRALQVPHWPLGSDPVVCPRFGAVSFYASTLCFDRLEHFFDHLLGVAEHHHGVIVLSVQIDTVAIRKAACSKALRFCFSRNSTSFAAR
ncbi:hypothetical protein [Cupriavidus pinatubonensis]|uniref:hypothetical protein n=1 Tax=Cupriavidus pinatubonensis TaxID=248026 RepID=UPI00361B502E